MLLLAHLAKIQGLKGEFLLHEVMDKPEKLQELPGLVLAPPEMVLDHTETAAARASNVCTSARSCCSNRSAYPQLIA